MRNLDADVAESIRLYEAARNPLLFADLMCGAGGSTEGAEQACNELGREVEFVVLNHWPRAIATHTANHPKARHYCQDISTVRPHQVCPEGYLDMLMASPSCVFHSVARGGKPTSDQQRSDPWHIIPWVTELDVRNFTIENVWEFTKWCPVDPTTGKPVKSREGEYFRAWVDVFRRVGFNPEWRKLNAANYGGATTRLRFIMKGARDRRMVAWAPLTHSKAASEPGTRRWRPAREIIDWTIKGRSIFNRPVPLAPKTLVRILAGARKFFWPGVLIDLLIPEIERSCLHVVRTSFAKRHTGKAALRKRCRDRVRQYVGWLRHIRGQENVNGGSRSTGAAHPIIVTLRRNADGRSTDLPIPALAAGGTHVALAEPVIINGRKGNQAKPVSIEPVPTLDTKGGVWLAEPFVLATGSTGAARAIDEPMPTATTGGAGSDDPGCARPMLVEPFMLSRHGEGAPRSTNEPTPTQVAKHSHVLISPYYGNGSGETCTSAEVHPLPTATAKARFGLVIPITHSDLSNRARDVEVDPLPTLTTAHRGELAFIAAQFGEREGQAPRVHSVDDPAPTIAATGHVNLVEAAQYDILFRMLEPHELAAAMGFHSGARRYSFTGTKTEQVKQIGNAVSVEMMRAEVRATLQDYLAPVPMMEAAE